MTQWSGLLMGAAYVLIATASARRHLAFLGARVWLLRRLEKTFPVVGKAQSALQWISDANSSKGFGS